VPYLDKVIDPVIGFDASDVMTGTFVNHQFRRKWTIKEEKAAFNARARYQAGLWNEGFNARVSEMTGLMEMEHRKMNVRSEVVTKEDIKDALKQEPRMAEIVEAGGTVQWDKYHTEQVGADDP
jgi:hypothetical protein